MVKINEICVLNQPKHALLSVIIVNSKFPLVPILHDNLDKIAEYSDIIFLFNDKKFKDIESDKIDKDKFSNLYKACAYLDSNSLSFGDSLFKILQYDREIFENHADATIMNTEDISIVLPEKLIPNIQKIAMSEVKRSVFEMERQSSEDFYSYYVKPKSDFSIKTLIKKFKTRNYPNNINKYNNYTTKSIAVHLSLNTIKVLIPFWENPDNKEYINSFIGNDPRYLIASLIKNLGLDILNINIEELELGEI